MPQASARHILVADNDRCEDLKRRVEGGESFSELAKQYSTCPSASRGGELGEFASGQMVPEFDRVVFSAPIGEVQGPVKTQFGYHLVEVTRRDD